MSDHFADSAVEMRIQADSINSRPEETLTTRDRIAIVEGYCAIALVLRLSADELRADLKHFASRDKKFTPLVHPTLEWIRTEPQGVSIVS